MIIYVVTYQPPFDSGTAVIGFKTEAAAIDAVENYKVWYGANIRNKPKWPSPFVGDWQAWQDAMTEWLSTSPLKCSYPPYELDIQELELKD